MTLCLMCISTHALNETEINNYEEDEPQNVPGPPFTLYSWNVSGAVRAFLSQGVGNIFASSLAFSKEIDVLAKEQASEDVKDLPLPQWEPLTLPIYTYVPLSEWEPLTLPFYASVLNYVPYFVFEPVDVLSLLSLLTNVPYYAIKPASVLSRPTQRFVMRCLNSNFDPNSILSSYPLNCLLFLCISKVFPLIKRSTCQEISLNNCIFLQNFKFKDIEIERRSS